MVTKDKFNEIMGQMNSLLDMLPQDFESFSKRKRSLYRKQILKLMDKLQIVSTQLDPIKAPPKVFDPSDPSVIGKLIARTLLASPLHMLDDLDKFYGSGVYALYYTGNFIAYRPISNKDIPVYVGKVDPKSSKAINPEEQGVKLWNRLVGDHAKNLGKVKNLSSSDFRCRYLVVKSAWQNTAEKYLIDWFKPVWNDEMKVCFGIGKHGDSVDTRANTNSPWDTLHPGRAWAETMPPNSLSPEEIIDAVLDHYRKNIASIEASLTNPFL